jgi:hypothetical protein
MNEAFVYRIRIARAGAADLFFINAMSPTRALSTDAEQADRFTTEGAALTTAHGIVTAQGGRDGFFNRLRPMLFKFGATEAQRVERAEVHVESARKFSNGRIGTWSANRKGALIVKNPFLAAVPA